jgi:hypothetical protein
MTPLPLRSLSSLIAASAAFVTTGFAAVPVSNTAQAQSAQLPATHVVTSAGQAQIAEFLAFKDSFTAGEAKLANGLALVSRQARGKDLGPAAKFANKTLAPTTSLTVVIRGAASKDLLEYITAHGGKVNAVAPSNDRIEASMPAAELEDLAARSDVGSVRRPPQVKLNTGSLCTQGYVSHMAKPVVENKGVTGNGVKVGILSDSALPDQVSALMSSGDLGPNTTVLKGQEGPPDGTNEGAAMMEIVQDVAPGAQIIFATAYPDESSFAANVLALQAAGCSIIGDDVSYSDEDPFQDGIVAQAVNQVVAKGAIYFSSAANSGNLTDNTSTTWEGDFNDGPTIVCSPCGGKTVVLHDFGGGNTGNPMNTGSAVVDVFWADPLGKSNNDYDVFVLDYTGSVVKGASMTVQNGSQDPYEEVSPFDGNYDQPAAGDLIVIARHVGSAPVAMHIETDRESTLLFATTGSTHGHNGGANTQSMAASFWDSAHNGTKPFDGTNNPVEQFSSDGPRQIFFNPDGSAITPGNFRFSTGGGKTLQKPDFAAADGVTTATPGFNPFYGTSAACPHACGVAALVKSAHPTFNNTQIRNALLNSVHGSPTAGWNRDAGFGVLDAAGATK